MAAPGKLVRKPVGLYLVDPYMQLSHLTNVTPGSAASVSKHGSCQMYDRHGFSMMKPLLSSRAILHTIADHSAILLPLAICSYSLSDKPSVKPPGSRSDRSCRQCTPGTLISRALVKLLQSGAV